MQQAQGMQSTLEDFFKALRGSDLEVSLNAQVDAARATQLIGWRERDLLKSALGATLAKTQPDRAVFDQAFDRFFRFDSFGVKGQARPSSPAGASQELQPDPESPPQQGSGQGQGGPKGYRMHGVSLSKGRRRCIRWSGLICGMLGAFAAERQSVSPCAAVR